MTKIPDERLLEMLGPLAYTTPAFRGYLRRKIDDMERARKKKDEIISAILADIKEVELALRESYSMKPPPITCETLNEAFENKKFRELFDRRGNWRQFIAKRYRPPAFSRLSFLSGIRMYILPQIMVWVAAIALYFVSIPLEFKWLTLTALNVFAYIVLVRGIRTRRWLGIVVLISAALSAFVTSVGFWSIYVAASLLSRVTDFTALPFVFSLFSIVMLGYLFRSRLILLAVPLLAFLPFVNMLSVLATITAAASFVLTTLFIITFTWAFLDLIAIIISVIYGRRYFMVRTKDDIFTYWRAAQKRAWKKFVGGSRHLSRSDVERVVRKSAEAGIISREHVEFLVERLSDDATALPFYLLWSAVLSSMIERGEMVVPRDVDMRALLLLGEASGNKRVTLESLITEDGFERIQRFLNNMLYDRKPLTGIPPPLTILITAFDEKVVTSMEELERENTLKYFMNTFPHICSVGDEALVERISCHLPLLSRTMRESKHIRDVYALAVLLSNPDVDVSDLNRIVRDLVQIIVIYENYQNVDESQRRALLALAEKYGIELVWDWTLFEARNGEPVAVAKNPHGFKFYGRKAYGQSMAMSFIKHQPILFMDANCSSLPEAVVNIPLAISEFESDNAGIMSFGKYVYSRQTVFGAAWRVAEETLCNFLYCMFGKFNSVSFLGHGAVIRKSSLAEGGLAYDTVTEDVVGELNMRKGRKQTAKFCLDVQIGKGRELNIVSAEKPHVRWAEGGTKYFSCYAWRKFSSFRERHAEEKFFVGYKFLYPFKAFVGKYVLFMYLFFVVFWGIGIAIGYYPVLIWGIIGVILSQVSVIPGIAYMYLTSGARGILRYIGMYPVLSSRLVTTLFGYAAHGFERGISVMPFTHFQIAPKAFPSSKKIKLNYPKLPLLLSTLFAMALVYAFLAHNAMLVVFAAFSFFVAHFTLDNVFWKAPMGSVTNFAGWGSWCVALCLLTVPYPDVVIKVTVPFFVYAMIPIVAAHFQSFYMRNQRTVDAATLLALCTAICIMIYMFFENVFAIAFIFSLFYILSPLFVLIGLID